MQVGARPKSSEISYIRKHKLMYNEDGDKRKGAILKDSNVKRKTLNLRDKKTLKKFIKSGGCEGARRDFDSFQEEQRGQKQ